MIKFDVQFKPNPEWEREFAKKSIMALEQTGAALYSDLVLSGTVPFDTGSLQNVLTHPDYTAAADGIIRLVSKGPYARRLYFHPEYNFRTDKNPFAGGRWFDPYLPGHAKGDFVAKTFAEVIAELI